MSSIKGKIINHNDSFVGEIFFEDTISNINKINSNNFDNYIIPGFVDLHCHGGNGFDVMEGLQSIKNLSSYHLLNGTTTLLATTWTSDFDHIYKALKGFNKLINSKSNLIGIHLEGPFINPKKLGAQPSLTQKPSFEFIENIKSTAIIKVITLAPELENMEQFIPYLHKNNINIQFGHTLANYACCKKYMKDFEVGFTHLYNAMSGNDHRKPGVLTAALNDGNFAEIICDKMHVSEEGIKIAKKCIPGLYAITDSISANGLNDGLYKFANTDIEKKGNKITLKGKETLAGSTITMHETFLNLVKMNFSLEEAVKMTSYNASQYLKINDIGFIKKNNISNFLVLDKGLNLKEVYLNGKKTNS